MMYIYIQAINHNIYESEKYEEESDDRGFRLSYRLHADRRLR